MNFIKRSDYAPLSDEELVELSRSGDECAFNALAARYLNTRSRSSTASYVDRDDFVQEGMFGFLNAVRTFDSGKGVSFKVYSSVCMNNSIRSAAGNISPDIPTDTSDEAFASVQGAEDPLNRVITAERLAEVLGVCDDSLSSLEKTVVIFRAAGLSYKEIGDRLGMEPKTVDNAVQRARRKIKQVITPEG